MRINDARIEDELVRRHERMLTGGFYAEITITYDPLIAQEHSGRPFAVASLREIQLSKRDILEILTDARALQLVGDREPRQHQFSAQFRAFDAARSGGKIGVAGLVAMCTALLKKSVKGGLIIVGELNLGGSIEPVYNPVTLAEIAVEKGAVALLMPVSCRRQLIDLSDDMATKIDIQFYADARDALIKAMVE